MVTLLDALVQRKFSFDTFRLHPVRNGCHFGRVQSFNLAWTATHPWSWQPQNTWQGTSVFSYTYLPHKQCWQTTASELVCAKHHKTPPRNWEANPQDLTTSWKASHYPATAALEPMMMRWRMSVAPSCNWGVHGFLARNGQLQYKGNHSLTMCYCIYFKSPNPLTEDCQNVEGMNGKFLEDSYVELWFGGCWNAQGGVELFFGLHWIEKSRVSRGQLAYHGTKQKSRLHERLQNHNTFTKMPRPNGSNVARHDVHQSKIRMVCFWKNQFHHFPSNLSWILESAVSLASCSLCDSHVLHLVWETFP